MLLSAAIHDYEHPGTNNLFQMITYSEYALTYNDKSVLEMHHISASFVLMKSSPHLNILANLSEKDYKEVRKMVIEMVLGTDMSVHFHEMGILKGRVNSDDFDLM